MKMAAIVSDGRDKLVSSLVLHPNHGTRQARPSTAPVVARQHNQNATARTIGEFKL